MREALKPYPSICIGGRVLVEGCSPVPDETIGVMPHGTDLLLAGLVKTAYEVDEALPERISEPMLQPIRPGLDWPAGVALQGCIAGGIDPEDLHAVLLQVRARAISDALWPD